MNHDFLERYTGLSSPIHKLDARTKIIIFFLFIVICVTTPPTAYPVFLGYFSFILLTAALSAVPFTYIFKRSLVVIPFVAFVAIFLPFLKTDTAGVTYRLGPGNLEVSRSGLLVLWNALVKSYISVISAILLASTTPFPKLLHGLEQLRLPHLFITLTGFTYRYIFVLVDEVRRMKRARDSRCFGGKWIWHTQTIGRMIGTLFLRSYERGERIYMAMLSRGFEGGTARRGMTRLMAKDYLSAGASLAYLMALRLAIL